MATIHTQPDPYRGWSVIGGGAGNVTAYDLMADTSGAWRCVLYTPWLRRYRRVH